MDTVIVDCGIGNLGSIQNMLKKVGASATIASLPSALESASRLILPGVGAFDHAIHSLRQMNLEAALKEAVFSRRVPILGLCVGMQIMADSSDEGIESGLGWIPGKVRSFKTATESAKLRIPHMGWNEIHPTHSSPLLVGLETESRFYFVHSYFYHPESSHHCLATTRYGENFAAMISRDNIYGVQFHPEKSHKFGMKLFENFLRI